MMMAMHGRRRVPMTHSLFAACLLLVLAGCENRLVYSWKENPYFSYREVPMKNGASLYTALILPENPGPDESVPVLIAFPPGDQSQDMVEWAIGKYWIRASILRNWVVASPIAPGASFYEGSEILIPELMDWLSGQFQIEGGRFHVAGMSAGGYSAFRIALDYPDRVASVLAFPGYPPGPDDASVLSRLAGIPVAMDVGQFDTEWVEAMNAFYAELLEAGVQVAYRVIPNEEHVINSLTPEDLFEQLDGFRPPVMKMGILSKMENTGCASFE